MKYPISIVDEDGLILDQEVLCFGCGENYVFKNKEGEAWCNECNPKDPITNFEDWSNIINKCQNIDQLDKIAESIKEYENDAKVKSKLRLVYKHKKEQFKED
jgi:hypothetical protein